VPRTIEAYGIARPIEFLRLSAADGTGVHIAYSHWKAEALADHALSSSTKPGGIFGGSTPSLALQSGQGMPGAPQPQA
jgi:hypothetical protein